MPGGRCSAPVLAGCARCPKPAGGCGPTAVRIRGWHRSGQNRRSCFTGGGRPTARLQAMVTAERAEGGLIMVTGASGAGKSSLLHADLLPALSAASGEAGGPALWPQVCFTPSERPLQELCACRKFHPCSSSRM
ncbi:hypothetical protein [Nonomuraea sp. NPDC049784]|uniref:nSTAND1 domain-containing NTPase n=1 Tax=Nonomuraea sp. NPDC049784 TaxID=3154361 RepID=UPI0033F116F8